MLPFIPDMVYKRTAIHQQFGGQAQGGISTCARFPYIFIFSSAQGISHGYLDGWDNPNIYSYTGEGQIGDMKFVRGNLALRDHLKNGKRVFLFEEDIRSHVRFITELEFHDYDFFPGKDRNGDFRIAIRYFLKRSGAFLPIEATKYSGIQTVMELDSPSILDIPNITERQGLVTSRVGQGAYRKRIIHRWVYKCAVTGFNKTEILIASHIVAWKFGTNEERLDVNNGILLSPVYDALFDRKLITFQNDGKIILSNSIEKVAYLKIGVDGKERIKNFNSGNIDYLDRHRQFFQ